MTITEFFTAYSEAVLVLIGAICHWATENYSFVVVSVVLILAGLEALQAQAQAGN